MWGFEIGADDTFYSGSNWTVNRYITATTGANFYNAGISPNKTDDLLYDYRYNYPHQPTSSVGGGYYSLKVNPPAYHQSVYDTAEASLANLWMSMSPMAVMTPQIGVNDPITISFSMHCDLETSQWPFGEAGFKFSQRFLSLYPEQTTTGPLVVTESDYIGGFPQTASGDVPNNLPLLPPSISLFMHATGTAGVIENRIVAVCITGSSLLGLPFPSLIHAGGFFPQADSVPSNTRYTNLFGTAQFASFVAEYGAHPSYIQGFQGCFIYTSSAGDYIQGDKWTEITVQYTPDKTNGALRVYLDGTNVINVEGVPTAYTASYDWDTGALITENLGNTGRIEFPSTGFFALPGPNSGLVGYSSSIEPATFVYDHIVVFDEASDLETATGSIFIQGLIPTSDGPDTGNFEGDDSGSSNLYNYINDPNEAMETSYIQGSGSTSASFNLKNITNIEEGAKTFDPAAVSSYVGVGIINAYKNVGASNINVNPLMDLVSEASASSPCVVGASQKQMCIFVSGSDPSGTEWTQSDINSLRAGIKIS